MGGCLERDALGTKAREILGCRFEGMGEEKRVFAVRNTPIIIKTEKGEERLALCMERLHLAGAIF